MTPDLPIQGRLGEFLDLLFGPKQGNSEEQPLGGLEGAKYPIYILVDESDLEHAIGLRNEAPSRKFFIVTVQSASRGSKFMASMLLWFAQSLRASVTAKLLPFERYLSLFFFIFVSFRLFVFYWSSVRLLTSKICEIDFT